MKNDGFIASILEDDQFIVAEFLAEQLETYDPDTKDEEIKPVLANADIDADVVLEKKVKLVKKQKKKRDRRIKQEIAYLLEKL